MKLLAVILLAPVVGLANPGDQITDFARSFESDPMAPESVTFGIQLTDSDKAAWSVEVTTGDDGKRHVDVRPGLPTEPTFYYTATADALAKVHSGQWSALTAMGKAFSTDVTPMDIEMMEGFEPTGETMGMLLPLTFHFWNRGDPEIVRFSDLEHTRFVHGGHASLFYYQPGIRLGAGFILPGEHVNKDERSRTNPFPSYIIMTEGEAIARIDGKDHTLADGEAMFIGPGVSHEFLNETNAPAQFVLVMFGEGA